ncbi:hypothetical protein LguiA_025933 [Lonicera macranthoides]
MKKTTIRDNKTLTRGNPSTSHIPPPDPDAYQWNLYLRDEEKKKKAASVSVESISVASENIISLVVIFWLLSGAVPANPPVTVPVFACCPPISLSQIRASVFRVVLVALSLIC